MNVFSIHADIWARLQARRERLPHALLITGQRGLGKYDLAKAFASGLLCEAPQADGTACQKCLACNWFAQGNHPDFRLVVPEAFAEIEPQTETAEKTKKASQQITIDQVRELDDFFTVGTHRAGLRIILVNPAEAMNRSTANALLKTLEEPPASTLFLLVSSDPSGLLPTIRSRCQAVPVAVPDRASALAALNEAGISDAGHWLALAGGAPLLAQELASAGDAAWLDQFVKRLTGGAGCEPLAAAADIDKLLKDAKGKVSLRQVVDWAEKWVVDLALAASALPVRYFSGQRSVMEQLAAASSVYRLLRFYRQLVAWRHEVEQPLNPRLFLETFFLDYRALFSR